MGEAADEFAIMEHQDIALRSGAGSGSAESNMLSSVPVRKWGNLSRKSGKASVVGKV
jgi:hypothetical protein